MFITENGDGLLSVSLFGDSLIKENDDCLLSVSLAGDLGAKDIDLPLIVVPKGVVGG